MSVVTLYTTQGCHLCEQALTTLQRIREQVAFELVECDIGGDEQLHRRYFDRVPVIALDGVELCDLLVDEELLRQALGTSAAGRGSMRRGHPLESRRWRRRN